MDFLINLKGNAQNERYSQKIIQVGVDPGNKELKESLQNLIDGKKQDWNDKIRVFEDFHVLNPVRLQSAKG